MAVSSALRRRVVPAFAGLVAACALYALLARLGVGMLPSSWTHPPTALAPLPAAYHEWFPQGNLPAQLAAAPALAAALHAWLARPVLDEDAARAQNDAGCPRRIAAPLAQLMGDKNPAFWRTVDAHTVAARRASIVHALAAKIALGEQVVWKGRGTRGIVMTAGNKDTTARLLTTLRHLKRLGNTLPIEVFHYPGELTDAAQRAEIESYGARLGVIRGIAQNPKAWKNWQIKGLALIRASFRELVYLDSDNVPLRTLEHLFSAPRYAARGRAAFWPDVSKEHPDNAIWRIAGVPCSLAEWSFESGQIVLDKAGNRGLNLAALWIAATMMQDPDFWFRMNGGDKDTYRWAFTILGIPYAVSPRWMSALGFQNEWDYNKFCGHTTLQYDLVHPTDPSLPPPPLFVHSNLLKHVEPHGLGKGRLFSHIKRMALDAADEPSLNRVNMWVYDGKGRGMCLELDPRPMFPERDYPPGQKIEYIPVSDVPELAGFAEAWFDAGGKVGGWLGG